MNKKFRNTYLSILLFSLVLFLVHWGIDSQFSIITYYSIGGIYLFHVISAFAVAGITQLVYTNFKDYAGFAFMGTSLLKMLAAILFLIPGFLSEDKPTFTNILNFFIPYFLFLIFEAVQSIKLINPKDQN
ncbi:DUF6168 family protein [Psychroflexus sediminis]|uniref:ATP synthase protein I n=1 Tax=Psychroflexus sediminis TaxID=470826 RepID=A0A1G7X613_9FLAO|nr:DUF6168 family protein [Psychroflexus sediminis]SDG79577.1 hypothetical protein SAMN04488027_107110 [Psychroflexus sediminis]